MPRGAPTWSAPAHPGAAARTHPRPRPRSVSRRSATRHRDAAGSCPPDPAAISLAACENVVDGAQPIAIPHASTGAGPTPASHPSPASDPRPGPTARLTAPSPRPRNPTCTAPRPSPLADPPKPSFLHRLVYGVDVLLSSFSLPSSCLLPGVASPVWPPPPPAPRPRRPRARLPAPSPPILLRGGRVVGLDECAKTQCWRGRDPFWLQNSTL